ncbi:hypothetical protein GUA87_06680 [Sneathiella sp. P13V-1]|uniref:hypothetical protein n=1 Tax=Sneathiella sp. P13V-1 TaxID=2697366 RepID=UPI00187B79E7|nr:hypothetical protein [Sneathiella sp. P13V-1]MBE7636525.1 hypothetical protein [Sneathiella sp. P13V-1]
MISSIVSKKNLSIRLAVSVVVISTLAACVTKPIYNVDNQSFATSAVLPLSTVKDEIKMIGANRGWIFEDVKPGHMIGKVGTTKHNARVNLNYTETKFSISYLDSYNLKASNGIIHHRYNRWVELLERDLVTKLGLAVEKAK